MGLHFKTNAKYIAINWKMDSELKSIEGKLKWIENQLKVNWNKFKVNWNSLEINLKSIQNELKSIWTQVKIELKSIETNLRSIQNELKSIWIQVKKKIEINLKSIQNQLEINSIIQIKLKSIDINLKSIEINSISIQNEIELNLKSSQNQMKSTWYQFKINWNQLKSIWNQFNINWNYVRTYYSGPRQRKFPHYSGTKNCLGRFPTLIRIQHYCTCQVATARQCDIGVNIIFAVVEQGSNATRTHTLDKKWSFIGSVGNWIPYMHNQTRPRTKGALYEVFIGNSKDESVKGRTRTRSKLSIQSSAFWNRLKCVDSHPCNQKNNCQIAKAESRAEKTNVRL